MEHLTAAAKPADCPPSPCGAPLAADPLFALCKLQAATDGAFPEALLAHFYQVALTHCARYVGWGDGRVEQVRERVQADPFNGSLTLTRRPDTEVLLTSGPQFVAVIPKEQVHGRMIDGCGEWCCYCWLTASYSVGRDICDPCCRGPEFDQAVMRVFAFLVEHRGDETAGGNEIVSRSGAITFLRPYLTTIL